MTKIEHKDGVNVLDSYSYDLDDIGNISTVTQADGSVWRYQYDGRYRLTRAQRDTTASTPAISAVWQYTYDAGDNLLTKVEPFNDDFNDGDYSGWTATGGTWDASLNHCLTKTNLATSANLTRPMSVRRTRMRISTIGSRTSATTRTRVRG